MKDLSKYRWQIEKEIMRYPEWKQEYQDTYEKLLYGTTSKDGEIPCHTFAAGSRQEKIVEVMDSKHHKYIADRIKAVDDTMERLTEEKRVVIRLRYWSNPDKKLQYKTIARKCHMDERTARRICTAFVLNVGRRIGII